MCVCGVYVRVCVWGVCVCVGGGGGGVKNLTLTTKKKIYQACILSVLLYGSECWIPLNKHISKLNSFHHRCTRTILGISNKQQWLPSLLNALVPLLVILWKGE